MATYSFKDVTASINGFGGSINLANGAGVAEEGITIESTNDKNIMTIGSDGAGMHSLVADESSAVTVRLLKTSPTNAQLQTMYNLQTASSATHGSNVIVINDVSRGDIITLSGVAFKKRPTITYAKEGGMMEWSFDAIGTNTILGVGTPEI
jgi:hypothetical protein